MTLPGRRSHTGLLGSLLESRGSPPLSLQVAAHHQRAVSTGAVDAIQAQAGPPEEAVPSVPASGEESGGSLTPCWTWAHDSVPLASSFV